MKNGQKSSLYGEVSPYSEEIPYSERFSQIHYREYPLYKEIFENYCICKFFTVQGWGVSVVFIKSTMKTWLSSSLGFYASQVNALANALSAWSAEHLRLDQNFSTCSYKKNKLVKKPFNDK